MDKYTTQSLRWLNYSDLQFDGKLSIFIKVYFKITIFKLLVTVLCSCNRVFKNTDIYIVHSVLNNLTMVLKTLFILFLKLEQLLLYQGVNCSTAVDVSEFKAQKTKNIFQTL